MFGAMRWRRRRPAALVPADAPSGRALAGVVAILSFLAALVSLGALAVAERAADWRATTAREATLQVIPQPNRDPDADLARAVAIARRAPGIADVRVLTRDDAETLLRPWLGRGLDLGQLPVPRLATLILADDRPDLVALARLLAAEVPAATLDDHARWLARLRAAASGAVALAIAACALVLTATGLAVAFATQGAVAAAREVVEVLHLVGAQGRLHRQAVRPPFVGVVLRGASLGTAAAVAGGVGARRRSLPGSATWRRVPAFRGRCRPASAGRFPRSSWGCPARRRFSPAGYRSAR